MEPSLADAGQRGGTPMASVQAEAIKQVARQMRAQLEAAGAAGPPSVADLRRADETMGDVTVEPIGVAFEAGVVGGIPGLWATPPATGNRALLYLHGGGYVIGSPETHRKMVGHLAAAAEATAFVADYRLAPEHPFPAAVDDAVAAYLGLLAEGWPPDRVLIGGDSAGGGLALATMVALRDRGHPMPAGALLLSPWTDLEGTGESISTRAEVDLMVAPGLIKMMADMYLGGADARAPLASPLFADLAGLAPLYVQVGDEEVLLDDSTRLADQARAAGVEVRLEVFPEMQHVFQLAAGLAPEADEAMGRLGEFARARTP